MIQTRILQCIAFDNLLIPDDRGSFTKIYNMELLNSMGIHTVFQESYWTVSRKNVVRGMHFQVPPYDLDKLVTVVEGSIIDVVYDLRRNSETFGQTASIFLNAGEKISSLYVPRGCAHGFLALSDRCSLLYNVSRSFVREADKGFHYDSFGFQWPGKDFIVSERGPEPSSPPGFRKSVSGSRPMKIAVTGATGFIGTALVPELLREGHQVFRFLRKPSPPEKCYEGVKDFILSTPASFSEALSETKPDGIIHLATCFMVSNTLEELPALLQANITFGALLLETASQAEVPWFLNIGTGWQHYQGADYDPVNFYAATKQAFEDIARYYWSARHLDFVTLCLSDTYGPGDTRKKIFKLWKEKAVSGDSLKMSGGEQCIDILYIDDVIDGLRQAVEMLSSDTEKRLGGKRFFLSSGEKIPLKQLAEIFQEAADVNVPIQWGALPYRPREVMNPQFANAIPLPGWKSKVPLREGIRRFMSSL